MSDRVDIYDPLIHEVHATARMGANPNGSWVKLSDYDAAVRRAEEAERDLRLCQGHDIAAKFRMLAAERDDLLDKLIADRTRLAALDARMAEFEAGLRLYGSHHTPCPKSPHHDGYDFNRRCTCGLDDLIAANGGGKQ
jgi:hypothetical protein